MYNDEKGAYSLEGSDLYLLKPDLDAEGFYARAALRLQT